MRRLITVRRMSPAMTAFANRRRGCTSNVAIIVDNYKNNNDDEDDDVHDDDGIMRPDISHHADLH